MGLVLLLHAEAFHALGPVCERVRPQIRPSRPAASGTKTLPGHALLTLTYHFSLAYLGV